MQLRNYQTDGVLSIRESYLRGYKSVLFVLPTGGGKTVIFCHIAKQTAQRNKRVLILVHRVELLRQTSASLSNSGVHHGLIHPKYTPDLTASVQVASVQTLVNRLDKILPPDLIIIDECFPGNTLIDGVRIDSLKIGDYVSSFNHDNLNFESNKVIKLYKKKYKGDWYKLNFSDGSFIICTDNHPFYLCDFGYVPANKIIETCNNRNMMPIFVKYDGYMSKLQSKNSTEQTKENEEILQHSLQNRILSEKYKSITCNILPRVRKKVSVLSKQNTKISNRDFEKKKRFLFTGMPNVFQKKYKLRDNDENKQNLRFGKDEKKQSNVQSIIFRKNEKINVWKNFFVKRWEWSKYQATNKISRSIKYTNGACYKYSKSEGFIQEFTESLQSGFSLCRSKASNRSGWKDSQIKEMDISRQEENRSIKCVGLEGIEIHKQGSGRRPEWVPNEDTVYNIHVENNLNYFANNILVHNCHHATAGSWRKIMDHFDCRNLGVTATPIRGDGKGLDQMFDDMVTGPQIQELIDEGYLVRPRLFGPPNQIDLTQFRTVRGDFDKAQTVEVIDKQVITGSAVAEYTKLCPGAPAVIFCISVQHSEHVAEQFRASGYKAYSVDGSMDDETRSRILGGLADGSVQVVTSCDLISEGTDIPAVTCAIMLRPTKSTGLYIQQGGRALRPVYANGFDLSTKEGRLAAIAASNKKHAIILDHVGNYRIHEPLNAVRDWSLSGEKKKNKKSESIETFRTMQCPECYSVFEPVPICPVCGNEMKNAIKPPDEIEGDLEEITPEVLERMKKERNRKIAQARTLDELIEVGKELGHKRGWAHHIFKARQEKLK